MKTKWIDCRVERQLQRYPSSQGDTYVLSCIRLDGQGEEFDVTVKVREREKNGIAAGLEYRFFGKWTQYFNQRSRQAVKQWSAFCYCGLNTAPWVMELFELLEGRRFPRDLPASAVEEWGPMAKRVILKNPYALMVFPRAGFKLCDDFYLDIGLPEAKLRRQTYCAAYQLAVDGDGSTWHHRDRVRYVLEQSISGQEPSVEKALSLGVRAGMLSVIRTMGEDGPIDFDGSTVWIASRPDSDTELSIAEMLHESTLEQHPWPDASSIAFGVDASDHQVEQIVKACSSSIGLFIGGGGTGKTHTLASLIRFLLEDESPEDIALCAPTGKAAVRMSEAMAAFSVPIKAVTIHSMLIRYPDYLPFKYVFVDEASMVDLDLMAKLLLRRQPGTGILFIGDPGQLPPVGAGAPLRDMISFMPSLGELTEVRRNSGQIVSSGQQIRQGKRFDTNDEIDLSIGHNLLFIETPGIPSAIASIRGQIDEANRRGHDRLWDVQVIAQVNKKSSLSTSELNKILQNDLNPGEGEFRVGDKVMNTQNGWATLYKKHPYPVSDDAMVNKAGEVYVANGEMGEVIELHGKYMVVRMQDPHRVVMAPTWEKDPDSESDESSSKFVLAYAITTHKSQGAQWPVVIGVIDSYQGARRLMDRSLIYTLISRASSYCVLIGEKEIACKAVRKSHIWDRKTFLKERFNEFVTAEVD